MKRSIRQFALSLLPTRLREKQRYRFLPEDFIMLRKSDVHYAEDSLFTFNTPTFLQDPKFLQAYQLGEQTGSWNNSVIRWRAYVACWAAQQVARLPGDFVECGVNRGGLARMIIDYLDFQSLNKRFYLIDNFSGLVPEYLTEAERGKQLLEAYAYYQDNSKDEVDKTFAAFPSVVVVQGNVPDVLPSVPASSVAFLSLDLNCTMPEIKAAEFFWDKVSPGGVILLDDYTQTLHSEQQAAFDTFAAQRDLRVLALPTGQGVLFKPLSTT